MTIPIGINNPCLLGEGSRISQRLRRDSSQRSRRVIGWAMGEKPNQQLTLAALAMAVRQRRIRPELIHHSDQGAQYSCVAYQRQLTMLGITPSMSRKGNYYDNAVAECFFSTLKNEPVYHQIYHTRDEASREIFAFIEGFYSRQRLLRALAI